MKYLYLVLAIAILIGLLWILEIAGVGQAPELTEITITNDARETSMENIKEFRFISSAFKDGEEIPQKYTCDGENISPPLSIMGVPEEAESLALIMEDPDVPEEVREDQLFVHWVLYNIPQTTKEIPEGESLGVVGENTAGSEQYTGPCPPGQYEPTEHRYIFTLYALDQNLELEPGASKEELLETMEGHIVDEMELMGRYERP